MLPFPGAVEIWSKSPPLPSRNIIPRPGYSSTMHSHPWTREYKIWKLESVGHRVQIHLLHGAHALGLASATASPAAPGKIHALVPKASACSVPISARRVAHTHSMRPPTPTARARRSPKKLLKHFANPCGQSPFIGARLVGCLQQVQPNTKEATMSKRTLDPNILHQFTRAGHWYRHGLNRSITFTFRGSSATLKQPPVGNPESQFT